jgi:hypothetical protein
MNYVRDHLRPSMNIPVPADHEDCYNLEKYMMWIIMKDMKRHGEDIVDNLHVDKNNPLIIHPKSYIIEHKYILSFNKLPLEEIPFTSKQGIFGNILYNVTYKYDEIHDNNFRTLLRVIPVDLFNDNIFKVFNKAIELLTIFKKKI